MKLKMFQIDAFTDRRFAGNPAAVCPLSQWLPDETMQAIAAENNLAETAFFVPQGSLNHEPRFGIRWFTPQVEVDLCGHATLATGYVLFEHLGVKTANVHFQSVKSGALTCSFSEFGYILDFPSHQPVACDPPAGLSEALGAKPAETLQGGEDLLVVYATEADIVNLQPDFRRLEELEYRGIIVTAPGESCDFVSRFFGPRVGIDEDPVTGSAHTVLTPYWHNRLPERSDRWLQARQLSRRGGSLDCCIEGDRVLIAGYAVTYLTGEIEID